MARQATGGVLEREGKRGRTFALAVPRLRHSLPSASPAWRGDMSDVTVTVERVLAEAGPPPADPKAARMVP